MEASPHLHSLEHGGLTGHGREDFFGHQVWAEASLSLRDKYGVKVPYVMQPAQLRLNQYIQACRRKRKAVRGIVLKARQVMVSSAFAAHAFQRVGLTPGQRAMIVAHEAKAAMNIFGYYEQFDENCRPWKMVTKQARERDCALTGMISYAGGGYVHVQTAGNVRGGRSDSLRVVHFSEYGFYANARVLTTGILQCVPDDEDTMVLKESTANGQGGPFHEDWLAAINGQSDYFAMFFGYWEHPEYTRDVLDPARFQESLSKEERAEQEKYRLTLGQLAWRRWKIKNGCHGSVDTFRQEFPGCWEEAFLRSGRPRFQIDCLQRMPIVQSPEVGDLHIIRNGPKENILYQPNADGGALWVYKQPAHGHEYVIGVDVAEGIDASQGKGGESDPDYSVAFVADRVNGWQVAKFRARMEPGPFADYLMVLARWYNWAFLVPEANGPGIALLEALLRESYPTALIYHRRPDPHETFSDIGGATIQVLGWKTSSVTRVQLIASHDSAMRDGTITFRDANTQAEHYSFVYSKRNRAEANQGCHDDEVFAAALATQGLLHPPIDRTLLGLPGGRKIHPMVNPVIQKYGQQRKQNDERRGVLITRFE